MMSSDTMEQHRIGFLYELYKRSKGDPRQGVPYEELVEALGLNESFTKRIQWSLQCEGLVELTALPQITNVGRTVMDSARRRHHCQTIGMTSQGVQLMEDILANGAYAEPSHRAASGSDQ